ncbi:hypothetical protein J3R83DRAFT_980 [Lanmaoa asiatica]|nr:hypothetical protein J3R83DRAFT_980 [Lanmaoa asiatica]
MTFSRPLFEAACKAFVQRRHDWAWVEHAVSPGLGYMYRTTPLQKHSATSDPPEFADDPSVAMPAPDHLTCHQSVVLSPTFQVPTFYFSVYDSTGSPLGLSEVMHTSLLRKHTFEGMEVTAFSVGDPASNFPLLSFGDHPSLGSQCWYLHPCETGPAVEEILAAWSDARPQDSARHVRWLEAWFVMLSCVVDLSIDSVPTFT